MDKCFACGRKLGKSPRLVACEDEQWVHVGIECYGLIVKAGAAGYQPPLGGPRLFALEHDPNESTRRYRERKAQES